MELLVGLGVLALLAIPFALSLRRATTLFVIHVQDGKATLKHGRLPPRLLRDIDDVVRRPPLDGVVLRAVVEQKRPRLLAKGPISPGRLQQLRNVVGRFQLAQIRTGTRRA